MNNENLEKNVEYLQPLKKICMSIGTLPSSFLESMSYYEMLLWFTTYLQNTVIPTINNNAEVIEEVQGLYNSLNTELYTYINNKYAELKYYVDHYFDDFDIQTQINNIIQEMADNGELTSILQSFALDKTHIDLTNKTNLLSNTNWITTTGWTSIPNGFEHASGSATTLSTSVANIDTTKTYILKFTATNQVSASITQQQVLVAEFGGSGQFEQYTGEGTQTKYFTFTPSNGDLIFTPRSNWVGQVYDIALYELDTTDVLTPTLNIYDENNESAFATIVTDKDMKNITLSHDALKKSIPYAKGNIAIGENILSKTATSYWNVAIGYNTQANSLNGTRNISLGYNSLEKITHGDRNIAVGTFALNRITSGRNNIGIGADSGWFTSTGSNNVAIGTGALDTNTTGSNNIGIGYFAGAFIETGSNNISIGHTAGDHLTAGNHNISLGVSAHYTGVNDTGNICIGSNTMTATPIDASNYNVVIGYNAMNKGCGEHNIALGYESMKSLSAKSNYNISIGFDTMSQTVNASTDGYNVVIGSSAGRNINGHDNIVLGQRALNGASGSTNIAIGAYALNKATSNGNISLGYQSLMKLETGANNTAMGNQASKETTTGSNNIALGFQSLSLNTTGGNNIALGTSAGSNITSASNCIVIGQKAGINTNNSVVIGDIINYDGTNMGLITDAESGAFITLKAGSSSNAPLKLKNGTLLSTATDGCFEYDGSHLYFTIGTTRNTLI